MSVLGNRVVRREDPALVTGSAPYTDDVPLAGAARVTFVRSPVAHGRIRSVDVEAARAAPGVVAVLTAADVDVDPVEPPFGIADRRMGRPLLARDVVRHVGEPVAAIVSETAAQGRDAADLVTLDLDLLPAVVDPREAVRDEVLLFPEYGTNTCALSPIEDSDDRLFDGCDVVVRASLGSQRLAPCPLEARAAAASWGEDGRLTTWLSTQAPHLARTELATRLGVDEARVRVRVAEVGGGFGAKAFLAGEEVLVAWLARRLGRPVRWAEGRSESMTALVHGRAQQHELELGATRDGRLLAYRLRVLQDAGAYPREAPILPGLTSLMASAVYAIPRVEVETRSVVTNTTPVGAYRGAGRPEATQAIERGLDLLARELGLDPAELRRRNTIPSDAFPYTTASGATYDSGDYAAALELVLEHAGYDELRAEQRRRRAAGGELQLGIGLSLYVEITNPGNDPEFAGLEIVQDGRAVVRTGTSPHGQGLVTAFSMLVSSRLGLPLEAIDVVHGDTDVVPRGNGTMGSRSLQIGGTAVARAAVEVVELGRSLAAELLEARADDVVLDTTSGRFHVAGSPEPARSWAELALAAPEPLAAEVDFEPSDPTFPFGAHLAVVEVDVATGKIRLLRHVAVDDCGTVLNPLLAEGQRLGGIAQGAAQALLEQMAYDEDGNPLTGSLVDYMFPTAHDLPSFELVPMATPTPLNELGAKGIGESGTIGATPAVINAVLDALAPFGVTELEMPATPERVWRALAEARR